LNNAQLDFFRDESEDPLNYFTFDEYQDAVEAMPLYDDPVLGLIGEVGEVVEHIKKDRREGDRHRPIDIEKFELELGDVLWYLNRIAGDYGLDMAMIAAKNIDKLNKRHNGS